MVLPGVCHPGMYAGMVALQLFYNSTTGLWNTTKWWNTANALNTTIEHAVLTNTTTYRTAVANTFDKHKDKNFLNPWMYDDDGWWALTWIKAYDATGETRYLDMAKTIFNHMQTGWDSTCGGGLWWKKKEHTEKNAITNELFLTVAARLHLRTPGDRGSGSYLDWAQRTWNWFKNTKMINRDHLVNDGLDGACRNNGQTTWTYNQGVLIGGLVDLYHSTGDRTLLKQAEAIAQASLQKLAPNGILREACEPNCGADGPQFKGIFMRNLSTLYQVTRNPVYRNFIIKNANSIWERNRNSENQFGLSWAGPFDVADASRQSSAMDAINAAVAVNTQNPVAQPGKEQFHPSVTDAVNKVAYHPDTVVVPDLKGQIVTLNVDLACAGNYKLTFRYGNRDENASNSIQVNGRLAVNPLFLEPSTWNSINLSNSWLHNSLRLISMVSHALAE